MKIIKDIYNCLTDGWRRGLMDAEICAFQDRNNKRLQEGFLLQEAQRLQEAQQLGPRALEDLTQEEQELVADWERLKAYDKA